MNFVNANQAVLWSKLDTAMRTGPPHATHVLARDSTRHLLDTGPVFLREPCDLEVACLGHFENPNGRGTSILSR